MVCIEIIDREIAEEIIHEEYQQQTISNDIAVVKVSMPFVFDGKWIYKLKLYRIHKA